MIHTDGKVLSLRKASIVANVFDFRLRWGRAKGIGKCMFHFTIYLYQIVWWFFFPLFYFPLLFSFQKAVEAVIISDRRFLSPVRSRERKALQES